MIKVLFVCWGNICRSPMAEFVLKDMVKKRGMEEKFHIESRATHTDEIWSGRGNPVYPPAKAKLREHGISCEGKRAQLLVEADYDAWDYIIGMDDLNLKWMYRILRADEHQTDLSGATANRFHSKELGTPAEKRRGQRISLLMDYTDHPRSVADPWYTGDFEATWQDVNEGCEGFLVWLNHENQ